jgi:hypothetical protein
MRQRFIPESLQQEICILAIRFEVVGHSFLHQCGCR